jgi:hypothetical protein
MTSENEERTETETEEKRPDQERCEQNVLRPLIDRMIELGVLPEPEQDYTITWDDIVALEQTERDLDLDPETRDK